MVRDGKGGGLKVFGSSVVESFLEGGFGVGETNLAWE